MACSFCGYGEALLADENHERLIIPPIEKTCGFGLRASEKSFESGCVNLNKYEGGVKRKRRAQLLVRGASRRDDLNKETASSGGIPEGPSAVGERMFTAPAGGKGFPEQRGLQLCHALGKTKGVPEMEGPSIDSRTGRRP